MPLKAELHCHIEGAAAPELVIAQARKYNADTTPFIRDGSFVWHDFTSFLNAYD
ncbi:adenosine deaminase, partial [Rhizobiaceae sp. 2RAB30]